jgi:hypothetical protein
MGQEESGMTTMQFSPKSTIIRQFIEGYKPWIEEQLGVTIGEMIQLRFDHNISTIAAWLTLPEAKFADSEMGLKRLFQKRLRRVEFPPDTMPAIAMRIVPDEASTFASREQLWRPNWLDCPVAIHLEGMTSPIVVINVSFVAGGQGTSEWREIVLVCRDSAQVFLTLMQQAHSACQEPSLHYHHNGVRRVRPTQWEDLVLDPCVVRLLQNDYESFFQREAWFRENRMAFRRGYLLYGPPGNGKTSAIRAMLSRPEITGHTINLFKQDLDDDDLTCLFETAASTAPAVIVLEDIDRYFDQKPEKGPEAKVSLQHLLNCLDGATTQDGVIVVATANNPQVLDPAILRRPGRFDRVVGFANPTKDLRARYFLKLCVDMDSASIGDCADACEGFSFAQLQEAYIFAGQSAFDEERPVSAADILTAITTLRKSLQCADWKGDGVSGFKLDRR